ncbi:glycoside hydrolase 5 family protein [Tautonia plasticadhaerens]|uniref:hypothetical protein n=1 Tax=Tautonia plasticadhaerens TaxID=2527974 RepID=UPI0011A1A120|nr:hypothetical protein [Tautonia plasticadhaerens]
MSRALLGLVVIIGVTPARGQEPEPEAEQARPADAFVDSIGVNVHLGNTDTIYRRYDEIIRPRLAELGVRHVRDGLRAERRDVIARLNDLTTLGIRSILIVSPEEAVEITRAASASTWAVEGRNEPDNKGGGWEERTRQEQAALYRAIKGDPATDQLPVVISGMANTRDSPGKLGSLVESLDYGNMHSYPGGLPPTSGGWGIPLSKAIAEARKVCDGKPIVATETGYHNRLAERGHPGVSETAEAKYLPRLLLTYFDHGIARAYLYEFADEKPDPEYGDKEQHFGLLRVDGTPKPAFVALKNLIALLADPGPAFEPGALAHALEGDQQDIRRVLLARRDGTFDLILWQEVPSFDLSTREDIEVVPRALTLRLPAPVGRVEVYRPITSTEPDGRVEGRSEVPLRVPDDPLIVRIKPGPPGG